ncbi:Skp1 family, dimerization domain-containing protein [Thermothelomyces heterothallicus CBS 202.75]|uniref:Skp1 family, dimerization domain-containing protein n=1 Tax=Thermothelomyces heterothallicus CBS 202.75 TaxID=1149848 RepID=UPI0037436868
MAAQPDFLWIKNDMSPDGRLFRVTRRAAQHSIILRALIEDFEGIDFRKKEQCIPIKIDVSDQCLSDVLQWVENTKTAPEKGESDDNKHVELAAEDMRFFREAITTSEKLYELLMLADYLGIVPLYNMACQVVVNMIMGKSAEQIRRILGINKDFTPEQEEAIRAETAWAYDEEQPPRDPRMEGA